MRYNAGRTHSVVPAAHVQEAVERNRNTFRYAVALYRQDRTTTLKITPTTVEVERMPTVATRGSDFGSRASHCAHPDSYLLHEPPTPLAARQRELAR